MTSSNVPIPHPSQIATTSESAVPVTRDHVNEGTIDHDADPRALADSELTPSSSGEHGAAQSVSGSFAHDPDVVTGNLAQQHFPSWRFLWWTKIPRNPNPPRYRLPLKIMLAAVVASVKNQKRDIRTDVKDLVASMPAPPNVEGLENLPESLPFVILPNHYERPSGAWVGWGAIVISHAIARSRPGTFPIRWVMTSSWQDCYLGPKRIHPKYLHWILRRLSNLYGIILMPADDLEAFGRGAALREIFRALADPAGQVVAFHPEAGGFETMITPPKGMGRVLTAVDRQHVPLIPAGVFEDDSGFQVRFGKAIDPGSLQDLSDDEATNTVMLRIAALVPERTRGVYANKLRGLTAAATDPAIDGSH